MAADIAGNDAVDLTFNWYGQIFSGPTIRNAFRYGPSNFDVQAGYSHELYNRGPDLRLSTTGYKFDIGEGVYGWDAGAELKSRDGVFVLTYRVGDDRINETYHTVGGFINVGLQLERIFSGENPLTMPEPIFRSPRNLAKMLDQKVKRNWFQPASVVVSRPTGALAGGGGGSTIFPIFTYATGAGPQINSGQQNNATWAPPQDRNQLNLTAPNNKLTVTITAGAVRFVSPNPTPRTVTINVYVGAGTFATSVLVGTFTVTKIVAGSNVDVSIAGTTFSSLTAQNQLFLNGVNPDRVWLAVSGGSAADRVNAGWTATVSFNNP